MSKRYFYTDPLAAAWQAKHFGMSFDVNDFDGVMFRNWDDWQDFFTGNFDHFQKGPAKWRISPGSLHLLEPQISDLLQSSRGVMGGISMGFLLNKSWDTNPDKWTVVPRYGDGSALDKYWATPSEWPTIVQRSGILFMHPQSEDANG